MQNRAAFPGTGGNFILSLCRLLALKYVEEKFLFFSGKKRSEHKWMEVFVPLGEMLLETFAAPGGMGAGITWAVPKASLGWARARI